MGRCGSFAQLRGNSFVLRFKILDLKFDKDSFSLNSLGKKSKKKLSLYCHCIETIFKSWVQQEQKTQKTHVKNFLKLDDSRLVIAFC